MFRFINNEQRVNELLNRQASLQEREAAIHTLKEQGVQALYYSYTRLGNKDYEPSKVKLSLNKDNCIEYFKV